MSATFTGVVRHSPNPLHRWYSWSREDDVRLSHFIGGIHGVGKTTFASAISNAITIMCLSAGELIKSHRDSDQGIGKPVKDVQQNQNLLLDAIKSLRLTAPVLLDGHFCLLAKDGSVAEIPLDTFLDLNLKSITVLIDSPESIQRRLAGRDDTKYDYDLLDQFQLRELEWGKVIGSCLQIPFAALSINQVSQACDHIKQAEKYPWP